MDLNKIKRFDHAEVDNHIAPIGFMPLFTSEKELLKDSEAEKIVNEVLGIDVRSGYMRRIAGLYLCEGVLFSVFLVNSFLNQDDCENYRDFLDLHGDRVYDEEYMKGVFIHGEHSELVARTLLEFSYSLSRIYPAINDETSYLKKASFELVSKDVMVAILENNFVFTPYARPRPKSGYFFYSGIPLAIRHLLDNSISYEELSSESVDFVIEAVRHYNLEFWEMTLLSGIIEDFHGNAFANSISTIDITNSYAGTFVKTFREHIPHLSFSELVSAMTVVSHMIELTDGTETLFYSTMFEGLKKISKDEKHFRQFAEFCKQAISERIFKDVYVSFVDLDKEFNSDEPFNIPPVLWKEIVGTSEKYNDRRRTDKSARAFSDIEFAVQNFEDSGYPR